MKLFRYILCAIGHIYCNNTRLAKGSTHHVIGTCNRWMHHPGQHTEKVTHTVRWTEGEYYD